MSNEMVTLPNPDYLKEMLETNKANGRDTGLDPKIAKMVDFLDRAIRTQNTTIGTVTAAVGILLGRKVGDPDNLERSIYDVTTAVRVGFYLHCINKGK
jgi:hypothetical protein